MKLAKNSLFAILLRSPWWVSLLIALVLSLLAAALLPREYRLMGALSSAPFVVIAALAARRQWREPSAAQVQRTLDAAASMAWTPFAAALQAAFARDGYSVERTASNAAADFRLERQGRTMLVSARRWKAARTGIEVLRDLQAERDAAGADALYIGLAELTDNARAYAAEHRIAIWRADELARALKGVPLAPRAKP